MQERELSRKRKEVEDYDKTSKYSKRRRKKKTR